MVFTNFYTRAIFGILYAAIVVGGIMSGPLGLLLLVLSIVFFCWKEWLSLHKTPPLMQWAIGIFTAFSFLPFLLNNEAIHENLHRQFPALLCILGLSLMLFGVVFQGVAFMNTAKLWAIGSLYISLPLFLFLQLPQAMHGHTASVFSYVSWQFEIPRDTLGSVQGYSFKYPLLVFVLIWSSDTFAYLLGRSLGKNPLHSELSPKKTWEGFLGGSLLTAFLAGFLFVFLALGTGFSGFLFGALLSVFGTAGDLFESAIKRELGIKESGRFLPGHGGALDRFDSFLFGCLLTWAWFSLCGDL